MGVNSEAASVMSVIVCSPHAVRSHLSIQGTIYMTG